MSKRIQNTEYRIQDTEYSSIVGLLAGLYSAFKASKLNPIEALRYE